MCIGAGENDFAWLVLLTNEPKICISYFAASELSDDKKTPKYGTVSQEKIQDAQIEKKNLNRRSTTISPPRERDKSENNRRRYYS